MLIAAVVLLLTYIGIAFAHVPRLRVDRPTAALAGAIMMVLFGVLTAEEAIASIDFNTIALLLGMMVVVSALQLSGFFQLLAAKSLALATSPTRLLVLVVVATGISSAFFVNDAVVLLFTPIVISACQARKVNPVPYLVSEAMASNIGSAATIVGNPQNMLIGMTAQISFGRFFIYLFPVAVLSTILLILIMKWSNGHGISNGFSHDVSIVVPGNVDRSSIAWLLPVLAVIILGFFLSTTLGIAIPLIALAAGALALVTGRSRPGEVLNGVNWVLLLLFAGLFVVIGGAHKAGVLDVFTDRIIVSPSIPGIVSVHLVSAAVSQLVSNVPLAMLVIPLFKNIPGDTLWIALAAGSTLGGNLTIIGAVANIIVVEGSARQGIHVGFGQFFKIGLLVTLATVLLSILVLSAEYRLGLLR
ncbi:MAG: hypothetical protein HYX90_12085 [Chloroflexi bacterium]|nr:hypothetical protein [Chloroflexota bacterium]